jgi:hypothetical protein
MTGYVAMSRDWQDHDLFAGDEYSRRDAWAWLISQAAWKPTTARVKGAKVELVRGELCFSQRFLAEKWGWSKSRVDRFITLLRDEGMIETRSKIGATTDHPAGQGQSIISICNYAKYQSATQRERGNVEPDIGATAGQQRGKEETRKNTIPNGIGGEPADPLKLIFDLGVSLLTSQGKTESEARSLIGKWRKGGDKDGDIAAALVEARTRSISNLVEWMPKRLSGSRQTGPPSFLDHMIGERERREAAAR